MYHGTNALHAPEAPAEQAHCTRHWPFFVMLTCLLVMQYICNFKAGVSLNLLPDAQKRKNRLGSRAENCPHPEPGCLQVTTALEAIEPGLGSLFKSLTCSVSPAAWQSDQIDLHLASTSSDHPMVESSRPGSVASAAAANSIQAVTHAAVALHGLPSTLQPASATAFSGVRGLASVTQLTKAALVTPGVMDLVHEQDLVALTRAITSVPFAKYVCSRADGHELLEGLTSHKPRIVQSVKDQQRQKQQQDVLDMVKDWQVCA